MSRFFRVPFPHTSGARAWALTSLGCVSRSTAGPCGKNAELELAPSTKLGCGIQSSYLRRTVRGCIFILRRIVMRDAQVRTAYVGGRPPIFFSSMGTLVRAARPHSYLERSSRSYAKSGLRNANADELVSVTVLSR